MTDEVKEQVEEVTPQSTEQDEDAAFAAGFAEARGDEPPTEEPKTEAVAEVPVEPETEPAKEPEPEIVFAGLTEDQLKAQLAKAGEVDELKVQVRQLFGRMGEHNAKLNQFQQARTPVKLSKDQFKSLGVDYADIASALAEDLSGISLGGGQSEVDLEPIKQQFHQELAQIKQENEMKLLKIRHRDWETVRSSDDFKLWEQQQLSTEERQKLNTSWDAMEIADSFDAFKEWRAKSQEAKQSKQNRLAAAVTPTRGVPAAVTTINDDDAFNAGFKRARGL